MATLLFPLITNCCDRLQESNLLSSGQKYSVPFVAFFFFLFRVSWVQGHQARCSWPDTAHPTNRCLEWAAGYKTKWDRFKSKKTVSIFFAKNTIKITLSQFCVLGNFAPFCVLVITDLFKVKNYFFTYFYETNLN